MGCTQAELYRLADLLYIEACRGHEDTIPCKRLLRIINDLKAWSLDELRARLGL